jgi:hypothetical protein
MSIDSIITGSDAAKANNTGMSQPAGCDAESGISMPK